MKKNNKGGWGEGGREGKERKGKKERLSPSPLVVVPRPFLQNIWGEPGVHSTFAIFVNESLFSIFSSNFKIGRTLITFVIPGIRL